MAFMTSSHLSPYHYDRQSAWTSTLRHTRSQTGVEAQEKARLIDLARPKRYGTFSDCPTNALQREIAGRVLHDNSREGTFTVSSRLALFLTFRDSLLHHTLVCTTGRECTTAPTSFVPKNLSGTHARSPMQGYWVLDITAVVAGLGMIVDACSENMTEKTLPRKSSYIEIQLNAG